MKMKFAAMFALAGAVSSVNAAPLESDAVYNDDWSRSHAQTLSNEASKLIRANRYRCDSVSAINRWLFSAGFTVSCNGFRYQYDIEDKGGRWTVTLK